MNLIRCTNGHYYDGDKFSSCPHCQSNMRPNTDSLTAKEEKNLRDDDKTLLLGREEYIAADDDDRTLILENDSDRTQMYSEADEQKTMILSQKDRREADAVVGWLVGINGSMYGDAFPVKSGVNIVGRGIYMDVVLYGDESILKENHGAIIYEPATRSFFVRPGDARAQFLLDHEVVSEEKMLRKRDIVTFGSSDMMFMPFCDEEFCWEKLSG